MTAHSRDAHRLLAGLNRDAVSLELSTLDLCFLAALHLRAERDGLASFDEDLVFDVFEQICDLVEPGVENPRKRATHTIQRLRTQRMIARVDATGIISAGEYALTSLASAIIKSFLEDDQLTRESLSLLMGAVISSLNQIRTAVHRPDSQTNWRSEVLAPLRVTVGDLVSGIERRQRGLDGQQEDVRSQISELLQTDWFAAIEQCQALLETMTTTLQELNEVLLRDSNHIQSLLQEIQQAAFTAGANEADEAAQRVAEQVDRMTAWGSSRQHAWSSYYQYVHRFLRDVVRLDPDRALSQRLLNQIRAWPTRPFALVTAPDLRIIVLRSISARGQRPPVGRPHADRESRPSDITIGDGQIDLEELVKIALTDGSSELVSVTQKVVPQLEEAEQYRAMGQIAEIVAKLTAPGTQPDRPWVPVNSVIELENWRLKQKRETD